MRWLSVRQPFVHAIASGLKRIEDRAWPTRHRGDLLIHAGRGRQESRSAVAFAALMPGLPLVVLAGGGAVSRIPGVRTTGETLISRRVCVEQLDVVSLPQEGGSRAIE